MEEDDVLIYCGVCAVWCVVSACGCVYPDPDPPVAAPVPVLHAPDNPEGSPTPDLFMMCLLGALRGQIKELLATGVNVEQRGRIGNKWYTPLAMAARTGRAHVVQLLLENNADVHAHGRTILHNAAQSGMDGRTAVVKLLLDHGADVHATAGRGLTPLHAAADAGCPAVVWILILHGGDILARSHAGETVEVLATRRAHHPVVQMIQTETLPRAKGVAFAMALHERLGADSGVKIFDPDLVRMVLELV